jgi:hypothetical protein
MTMSDVLFLRNLEAGLRIWEFEKKRIDRIADRLEQLEKENDRLMLLRTEDFGELERLTKENEELKNRK